MNKILQHFQQEWYKYLLEIIVLIIGISGAFVLERWNDRRISDRKFDFLLEQYYNAIYTDVQYFLSGYWEIGDQINLINRLLANPDTTLSREALYTLKSLNLNPENFNSETQALSEYLDNNQYTQEQNQLIREIISYVSGNQLISLNETNDYFSTLLPNVPNPNIKLTGDERRWAIFTEDDLNDVNKALPTRSFQSLLKSIRSEKITTLDNLINGFVDGFSIMGKIKEYNPDLSFLIDQMSMTGTALEGWAIDHPMNRISEAKWQTEVFLDKGELKFRNRHSWNQNWGGKWFPSDTMRYYGANIKIDTPGTYKVELDLLEMRYDFELIEQ